MKAFNNPAETYEHLDKAHGGCFWFVKGRLIIFYSSLS